MMLENWCWGNFSEMTKAPAAKGRAKKSQSHSATTGKLRDLVFIPLISSKTASSARRLLYVGVSEIPVTIALICLAKRANDIIISLFLHHVNRGDLKTLLFFWVWKTALERNLGGVHEARLQVQAKTPVIIMFSFFLVTLYVLYFRLFGLKTILSPSPLQAFRMSISFEPGTAIFADGIQEFNRRQSLSRAGK
jgi:hypothetical protein